MGNHLAKKGFFVTFEGVEGSGKSTLVRLLADQLLEKGFSVLVTREPGGTPVSEAIRSLILETSLDPWTELLLCQAARVEHVQKVLRPALEKHQIVLCDRFMDSTLAYQAEGRGLPWEWVQKLHQVSVGLQPHLTFFLKTELKQALSRAKNPNRFEEESLVFHQRVEEGFLKAGREAVERWVALTTEGQTSEMLAVNALQILLNKMKS